MNVGEIVHKLRKDRKMTLLELATKSGVALATLSRMENGKMTGTLESHIKICRALDVSLPDIYKDLVTPPTKVELQAHKPGADISIHDKRASSELLAANSADKKMVPIMTRIASGGSSHLEITDSGTEKFIYLLDGRLEAAIGGEKYVLSKGDTLYFGSSVKHQFKNTGTKEARFISVVS